MLQPGTEFFVEKSGNGFGKIQGYSGVVLSTEKALEWKKEGVFIEGLLIDEMDRQQIDKEGIFFVEIHNIIFEDDEGENSDLDDEERVAEYDSGSIWAVKETDQTVFAMTKYCNRCHSKVTKSDLEEYAYQCLECDEDLYEIETYSRTPNDKKE